MNESSSSLRKFRKVQYGYYSSRSLEEERFSKPHPVIRIAGKYLEKFGFRIGDGIEVEIADGRIMVRRLAEPQSDYAGSNTSSKESGSKSK